MKINKLTTILITEEDIKQKKEISRNKKIKHVYFAQLESINLIQLIYSSKLTLLHDTPSFSLSPLSFHWLIFIDGLSLLRALPEWNPYIYWTAFAWFLPFIDPLFSPFAGSSECLSGWDIGIAPPVYTSVV